MGCGGSGSTEVAQPEVLEGGWRVVGDEPDREFKGERLIAGGWRVVDEAPPRLPVRALRAVKGVLAPAEPAAPDEDEFERIAGTTRLVPPVAGQREMARREPGGAPGLFATPTAPPEIRFGRLKEVPEPALPGMPEPEVSDAVRATVTEAVREGVARGPAIRPLSPEAAALAAPPEARPAAFRGRSVMVPPRTAVETVTRTSPVTAARMGLQQSVSGLIGQALAGGGAPTAEEQRFDPTLLDQAIEAIFSLGHDP